MKDFISSFGEAWSYYRKDKYVLLFSFIPVIIGFLLYSLLGNWLLTDVYQWGNEYISSHISSEGWLSFVSSILAVILGFVLLVLINFSFVLVVSLFASPFNDLISSRVERLAGGEAPLDISRSIKDSFKNITKIVINEIKKITIIAIISLVAFILSFFFPPLTFVVSSLLLAVTFLDYSWCRHEMTLRKCLGNMKDSFLLYLLGGAVFMTLISIPILNLFLLSYGVVYFTVLFTKRSNLG